MHIASHPGRNGRRTSKTERATPFLIKTVQIDGGMEELKRQLDSWAYTYNHVRPHRTLDLLTPYEYYRQWIKTNKPNVSLMYLPQTRY